MTINQLRNRRQTVPFQPYTICLASGRKIHVKSPELVAVSQAGRRISVAVSGDAFDFIDLLLVESIEVGNGARRRSRRR